MSEQRHPNHRTCQASVTRFLMLRLLGLTMLCGAINAYAQSELRGMELPAGIRSADQSNAPRVYIVQLKTPSAAEVHATANSRFIGKPAVGQFRSGQRFDKTQSAVQNHVRRLDEEQADLLAKADVNATEIYRYRYSLNGFAAKMSPVEANKLRSRPEVLQVWEDEVRTLSTNHSPSFLGLFEPEVGLRGVPGLDGDGIVIGFIDSGIYPEHPALQDTREADRPQACRSSWGENSLLGRWLCRRFRRMDDVLVFEPPEDWNGICEAGPQFTLDNCNNKLIGARFFVEGARNSGAIDSGEIFSPRDVDGHGTHTATTAAGNRVNASIFGTFLDRVEGIAPKARVAAYKACWLRPGATRSNCNTSDLANAIDMAVADGVEVISYSVGNSMLTVTGPDDIALIAAAKAGVITAVAGGNEGPNFQTIGSPSGNPAVITVAASTREGQHSVEAVEITAPASVAGRYASREASFTPPLIDRDPLEGQLVLVDDDDDSLEGSASGNSIDGCQALINSAEVSGNIAYIQRGGCDFDVKVSNAENAGAIAVVVFNISGAPIVMVGDGGNIDIPALMIGAGDGNLLLDEINNDATIEIVLDKGLFLSVADTGNVMANFSSRGPGPIQDILKPDVTAPGVNILAGNTPDAVNTVSGELFAFLSGTSMSTPHVAGVAALLKQGHPDWSPAAIKSALMTTARQDVTLPDDEPVLPFDYGSGHIVPNSANDPGLVYEISDDEYDAFSCGAGSAGINSTRCDELAAAGLSFDAVDLNQPSISFSELTRSRTVTRRVTNVTDSAETYTAELIAPNGVDVQISPSSLTVGAGQSTEYDVTFAFTGGQNDIYRFGSLTWVSTEHRVRSVIAIRPLSIGAPEEVTSSGGSGSLTFPVDFGYSGSYFPQVTGLLPAAIIEADIDDDPATIEPFFVPSDPSKTFSFRDIGGVRQVLPPFEILEDQLFLRFELRDELTDGDDDLDMYLYYCPPEFDCTDAFGNAIPEDFFMAAQSGEVTSDERIDVFLPLAGTYLILVHGFETDDVSGGPGANFTMLAWQLSPADNVGNLSATGPATATPGTSSDVTINWTGLATQEDYLGGIEHMTPDGRAFLTIVNITN